jgi:MFS family permease
VAIISSKLLKQANLAQSIAPLHVIGSSFGVTDTSVLSWLPAAYSLTVGTFILHAGGWGDLYGHKVIFVIGHLWFAVWSLIAEFSKNLAFFAACRAMQGVGPALLLPNGIAILSGTYPPGRKKEMILSLFGATAPGDFVLGRLSLGSLRSYFGGLGLIDLWRFSCLRLLGSRW